MDTQTVEIWTNILQPDEIDKIPSDIVMKLEKYCESRNENFMTTKVLYDVAREANDTLLQENEQLKSRANIAETENNVAEATLSELNNQLEKANSHITELINQISQQDSEKISYRKERNDIVDERDILLKMSDRKDGTIERLMADVKLLEAQLQSAVSTKFDALARLDAIEGKEQSLEYKEKRMETEKELLNNEIANLTDNLNRNMNELMALRQEFTSTRTQFEIDLKQKIDELRIASTTIRQLTETNESLTNQCEENALKLKEQVDDSVKLMEHYQKELDAKIKLAELYKENSDDSGAQTNELSAAVKELKRMLNETTDQCGIFETTLKGIDEQHQLDLDAKDSIIAQLKQELRVANDLLKTAEDENADKVLESFLPSAAAANRRLKSGLTLSEIYTRYYSVLEELQCKEREHNQLKLETESIILELQEKAPEFERQVVENKKIVAVNEELTQKIENFIAEKVIIREELQGTRSKFGYLERENIKLKRSQNDLARQICHLLNELEYSRGGTTSDQDQSISSDMPANEVISNKLVTFNNIVEMQENNQKLLLLVRDLSTKLEEMEEIQSNIDVESYEAKVASYEKRLHDAEQARLDNETLLNNCVKQKDRFKQLYYEIMKDVCKKPGENIFVAAEHMEGIDDFVGNNNSLNQSQNSQKPKDITEKKFLEMEQKLQEKVNELQEIKDEYSEHRKISKNEGKTLNEQNCSLRNEIKELTSANCKLSSQTNFANEQIKTQQKNIAIYKNKIQTLEERIQMLEKTVNKHETASKYLRDEAMNTMKKLSAAENRSEQLQRDNRRLIELNRALEIEQQALNREKVANNSLQSNLEIIKSSFERLESESRVRMEQRLDDASRECSALRRRLQEEQDHFRDEMAAMRGKAESYMNKLIDEESHADTLRSLIRQQVEKVELKTKEFEDFRKNIQPSFQIDSPVVNTNTKNKDLELQLKNSASDIEKLKGEINRCIQKEAELRQIAAGWEEEARLLKENFDIWKSKIMADLQMSQQNETKLKTQVDELQTEIRLQITESQSVIVEASSDNKTKDELKEALLKISENNRELRDLRSECHQLKTDLQHIEHKYSNEMQAHSSDLQTLTLCKEELNKCEEQVEQLRAAERAASDILEKSRLEWGKVNKQAAEDRLELEQRLECLDKQNSALHDHLQAQNNKVLSTNDSFNDSITNSSILNRTLTDDEAKETSSEKLLKVIQFLRKEKDIAITKVEILKIENTRLLNEFELQKKRLTELNLQLTTDKTSLNVPNVVSAIKYDDLMRKIETLNAMTDSNIHLREERDALVSKVSSLTDRVSRLEDESFPLQEKNRELLAKTEEQSQVNQVLRTNLDNWRKRASDLVERNNKNPEDFKRLQNERENLAKMLTFEKENVRQVSEELGSLKSEKLRLEQDLTAVMKQLQVTVDDRKRVQDDFTNSKQTNQRLTQEIIEVKSAVLKKEDEIKTIQSELSSKDAQLNDSKSKEMQIRRIAKKYKDSYYELKTEKDERDADLAAKSLEEQVLAATTAGSAGLAAARMEAEKVQSKKIEELSSQLTSCQEEIDQLKKENDNLKKQDEKNQLTEARNRITALTEANRQISRDYQISKSQLQTCEQSRSEHDSVKSQLEAKIKELLDQDTARQETITRITRENETLNTRVNQLHRQFQQQGTKPSTSSGTIEKSPSDPARTANVKPMATPSAQQSATVNPRRGGDTPLASIRPMSVQNSRTAAVLPTSQTSNIAAVQGSSTGGVTTALVPPQQQVHTTGNSSTAEAMSSSPTSSHTDYMPATSSAVVVAVPPMGPMGSTSAESTQEAESLSVNTNESSSSSTSSQAVLQQQTVALVSPRVEVTPQNIQVPSQQVVDQNQAASTSGSSSSFLTAMSSHHQASSSNTVTTTQAGGHKRPRDAEGDSSTGVEESSASEKTSPQNKRTRLGEQTFQGVTESGLDVEYQVPTSSQRDQEDDVVAVDSEDEDDEGMDDEATADVDEAFDAENGDTDEIESFGQDEVEGHDIDEDNVPNDNNEVDVDDSSDTPNQSSSGVAASSGARPSDVIESPLGQETQQIQTISSGSDAGTSGQVTTWRQVQTPTRQQQNLVIQQAYEETGDDSIVPSTPTLYVARRVDGEAVCSPHPIVPHASRFTFNESGTPCANRASATLGSTIEGMDDTRMDLNLLDESVDAGQGSSVITPVYEVEHQQIEVVDLIDESSTENKEAEQKEPIAGLSSNTEGSVPQIMVTDVENNRHTFDDSASTSQVTEDKNVSIEADVEDEEDVGTDGVSSEGEKSTGRDGQVEEGREAEASIQMPTDNDQSRRLRPPRRTFRGRGGTTDNQRPTPIVWDEENRDQQTSPQQQPGTPNRGANVRGQLVRPSRGRGKRPYRS